MRYNWIDEFLLKKKGVTKDLARETGRNFEWKHRVILGGFCKGCVFVLYGKIC